MAVSEEVVFELVEVRIVGSTWLDMLLLAMIVVDCGEDVYVA